ncbi:MAG TPA: glycosyltransferase family 2 protein [Steroidobacteraceae bacterium]|nr:glycosyltransferase family 2 protein [Steroidobacteraceae bacterium]
MRLTLLVTTFDRPDALACVLASIELQSQLPDEVIIADDGSGPSTARVIDAFRTRLSRDVHHAWQRHDGPRVGRARNVGIAMASGDYIVQIDGDMALHPKFIADHARAARPGYWVQGTRILLDDTRTRELIAKGPRTLGVFSPGIGFKRRAYAMHAPGASALLRAAANAFIAIKGCNQGFWRADLERVNGYDEAMTGWGAEDKELAARLVHAGVRQSTLLFAAIAYHLQHEPAPRDREAINDAILRETLKSGRTRCAAGLDLHRN